MVIEYFTKVKNRKRVFDKNIDITDPYLRVFVFHSLTESLKFASMTSLVGWPLLTLVQRSFIRGIKRPTFSKFFNLCTVGNLLYLSGFIYYKNSQKGFNYGKVAYIAQNNKRDLEMENWGWGSALIGGFLGAFIPGLNAGKLAISGFVTGFGFIYGSRILVREGYVERDVINQIKKNSPFVYLKQFSVSGGYDLGFGDEED